MPQWQDARTTAREDIAQVSDFQEAMLKLAFATVVVGCIVASFYGDRE